MGWATPTPTGAAQIPGQWLGRAAGRTAGDRALWGLVAALAVAVVGWVGLVLAVEGARFVLPLPPGAAAGVETAGALVRLFAALVLALFPDDPVRPRLRWAASGFLVLGLGRLVFGALWPLLGEEPGLDAAMYASLIVWTAAGALFAVGLLPRTPPRFSPSAALAALAAFAVPAVAVAVGGDRLPRLAAVANLEAAARSAPAALPGLTPWHWALSAVPLALAVAAAAGAARDARRGGLRGWLVVAMVLFAGAQLHNLFWPVAYRPLLTTGNLLRLAFGAVAALGGVLELRRVAAERAALLAAERDLAALRAGFGAMVAHELGAPVAAIRHAAVLLGTGPLAAPQARARDAIEQQAAALSALVADAQAAAAAEHDDFAVRPRPVPVAALLEDATAFAAALPGNHPLTVEGAGAGLVRADPERVGQVLRNLLGNAAKYSPEGAPIALRARRAGGRVRIEVADRGPGIPPDDLTRIFEKFGRGRDAAGRGVPGVGLGLYLSRRIVRAHGSELVVESAVGQGSMFGFDLEAAP